MKEFAIVSAFRAGLSPEENERRHAQLCEVLEDSGFDFRETAGVWDGVQEKAVLEAAMRRSWPPTSARTHTSVATRRNTGCSTLSQGTSSTATTHPNSTSTPTSSHPA